MILLSFAVPTAKDCQCLSDGNVLNKFQSLTVEKHLQEDATMPELHPAPQRVVEGKGVREGEGSIAYTYFAPPP